jgi:hypothetical protein
MTDEELQFAHEMKSNYHKWMSMDDIAKSMHVELKTLRNELKAYEERKKQAQQGENHG